MQTFKVPVLYRSWGLVEVEAESKEDLLKKLEDEEFLYDMPLPHEPQYVEESYIIDKDSYFYKEIQE